MSHIYNNLGISKENTYNGNLIILIFIPFFGVIRSHFSLNIERIYDYDKQTKSLDNNFFPLISRNMISRCRPVHYATYMYLNEIHGHNHRLYLVIQRRIIITNGIHTLACLHRHSKKASCGKIAFSACIIEGHSLLP